MSARAFARRRFLRGAGGIVFGLPLFEPSRRALAAEPSGARTAEGFPRRFVVFYTPNGRIPATWWPKRNSDADFDLSGKSLAPLEPFKSKMVVISGMDMRNGQNTHPGGNAAVLTGRPKLPGARFSLASGPSIDQIIGDRIGTGTRIKSLELGVYTQNFKPVEGRSRFVYKASGSPLTHEDNPAVIYDRVFSGSTKPPEELNKIRAQRQSVIDAVLGQFNEVRRQVGAEHRMTLDQHAEHVRDVERTLSGIEGAGDIAAGGCAKPTRPAVSNYGSVGGMPAVMKAQLNTLAAAIACDATRVATISVSNAVNHIPYPFINSNGDYHYMSHDGPGNPRAFKELTERETWNVSQLAEQLVAKLAAIKEGSGTALDNTLIYYCSELSVGNSHTTNNMPILLLGRGGGRIAGGRYLQRSGIPYNNLLVSFLNVFGFETNSFGAGAAATGPVPGL
jgi:hypothetical protein